MIDRRKFGCPEGKNQSETVCLIRTQANKFPRFLEDLEKRADTGGDNDSSTIQVNVENDRNSYPNDPSMAIQPDASEHPPQPPTIEHTRRVQLAAPHSETDSGRATPSAQLVNPFSSHAPRYVADSSGRPCKYLESRSHVGQS